MNFFIAAVLASCVTPTYSFSYLESLSGATLAVASPRDIVSPVPVAAAESEIPESPFFFTNGVADPSADSPAFFFTSGSNHVPAATSGSSDHVPAATTSGSYSSSGSSIGNYLDILGTDATDISGPGIANYVDALPQNNANNGPGIPSYAASLNKAASEVICASVTAAATPEVSHPIPELTSSDEVAPPEICHPISDLTSSREIAPTSGSYLEVLSTGGSASGAGIFTYLDALPQTCTLSGGAGISTYASNLVPANIVSGAGVATYTDILEGGISSFTNSFSPFGAASSISVSQSNFAIGSVTGKFVFSLDADAATVAQLQAGGNSKVTIRGKMMIKQIRELNNHPFHNKNE